MTPINKGLVADQVLADMYKIIKVHPSAFDVILCEAILTAATTEGVGNLDYENQEIDWAEPVTVKCIEVTKEMAPQAMRNLGIGPTGEYEEPLLVLLEKTVPEQSLVVILEIGSDGEVQEKIMSILESTGIGRDGRGGSIYKLIPFRGEDDEVTQEIEDQKEIITGEPAVPPAVDNSEFVWGSK